jgi:hypothetical protein
MNRIKQLTAQGVGLQQAYLYASEEDRRQWWESRRTTNQMRADALGYNDCSNTPIQLWELLTIGTLGFKCFRYNDTSVKAGGAKSQLGVNIKNGGGDLLSFLSDKPGVPSFEKFCEGMWTAAQAYYYTDADTIGGKDAIDVRNDFIELLSFYIGCSGGARRAALNDARDMYEKNVISPMELEAEQTECPEQYMEEENVIFMEQIEQQHQEMKREIINDINPLKGQIASNKGKLFRSVLAMTMEGKQFIIGLPRKMTAEAANNYVQYLRAVFDFIPLQFCENMWSYKAVDNLSLIK